MTSEPVPLSPDLATDGFSATLVTWPDAPTAGVASYKSLHLRSDRYPIAMYAPTQFDVQSVREASIVADGAIRAALRDMDADMASANEDLAEAGVAA